MAPPGSPNPYAPPAHDEDPPPGAAAAGSVRVLRAEPLPAVCLKCGARGDLHPRVQTFVTQPPRKNALLLGALFGALGGALAGAAAARETRSAKLEVPLCEPCNARWENGRRLVLVSLGFAAVAVVFVLAVAKAALGPLTRLGVLLSGVLGVIVVASRARRSQLVALHIDDEGVVLAGVAAEAKAALERARAAPPPPARKRRKKAAASAPPTPPPS